MISGVDERTVAMGDGSTAAVVTPHGELDLSAIASLDTAVRSVLAAAPTPPRLIVDLSDVSVLDPVVLGVLLAARRRCLNAGGTMALVVTAPEIGATLTETDVAPLFDVFPGLQTAIGHISNC